MKKIPIEFFIHNKTFIGDKVEIIMSQPETEKEYKITMIVDKQHANKYKPGEKATIVFITDDDGSIPHGKVNVSIGVY